MTSSPSSGIVAMLHCTTIFALKIPVFFCYPAVTEWLWAFRSPCLSVGESIFLLLGVSRGDKHSQSPEKTFCLTRGNVMVRSGTAHPKLLKTCYKQSIREKINRRKGLIFLISRFSFSSEKFKVTLWCSFKSENCLLSEKWLQNCAHCFVNTEWLLCVQEPVFLGKTLQFFLPCRVLIN